MVEDHFFSITMVHYAVCRWTLFTIASPFLSATLTVFLWPNFSPLQKWKQRNNTRTVDNIARPILYTFSDCNREINISLIILFPLSCIRLWSFTSRITVDWKHLNTAFLTVLSTISSILKQGVVKVTKESNYFWNYTKTQTKNYYVGCDLH